MVRPVFLVLGLLLLLDVLGQSREDRIVKSVSVHEGKRLDMLTRYDRKGNECFLYWDSETTAARAMEYDSLGRLIKLTDAHCNVGCSESTYEYRPGLKRTFELEFPNSDSTGFPREEAFSVILRKVQNAKALLALPEMTALHKLTPRLAKEEYLDALGHLIKEVSYDSDGRITSTTFQRDEHGRPLKKASNTSDGDTTRVEYRYDGSCEEPSEVQEETIVAFHWGYGRRTVFREHTFRKCDYHGNTVLVRHVQDFEGKIDTTATVYRFSEADKLIQVLEGSMDQLTPSTSKEYNTRGNLFQETYYHTNGSPYMTRTYAYNEYDEVVSEAVAELGRTTMRRYKYKYW